MARAEPWLGTHHRLDDHDLVVLPTARPVAFSVAGQPGQVVVSSGLWATLDPAEFEVLIAHEVAHLDFGHQRLLTVALVAERAIGWLPGVSRSLSSLRLGVERWADEEAAGRHPTRRRALQTALLAAAGTPAGALAAFGRVDGLVERIDALDRPAPVGSPAGAALLGTPAAAAALAGFGALGSWMGHAGVVLAMAVHCSA